MLPYPVRVSRACCEDLPRPAEMGNVRTTGAAVHCWDGAYQKIRISQSRVLLGQLQEELLEGAPYLTKRKLG